VEQECCRNCGSRIRKIYYNGLCVYCMSVMLRKEIQKMLKNNNGYTLFEILVLMGVSVLTCLIVWLIVGLGRFLWSL
jgi:hypothetical protein